MSEFLKESMIPAIKRIFSMSEETLRGHDQLYRVTPEGSDADAMIEASLAADPVGRAVIYSSALVLLSIMEREQVTRRTHQTWRI